MNKLTFFLLIGIFLSSGVIATDIAYVVEGNSDISSNIVKEIENLNYSYKVIYANQVSSTDFSDYGMILLGDGRIYSVPVSSYKTLILNPSYYTGWSDSIGVTTLNEAFNLNNAITQGLPLEFSPYTQNYVSLHYLTRKKYSTAITTKGSSTVDRGNFVVAKKDDPRRIFFGITESSKWSRDSKELFSNSLTWVLKGEDNDEDGFYTEDDCDDSNSLINPNGTEIAYNGVDEDCSGSDLTDVDEDGFDSFEVGGLDCNDNDSSYNPDSEDIYLNCRNDAPIINSYVNKIIVFEGQIASIKISAVDSENDSLVYSINDSRFVQENEGDFKWQTDYYSSGEYLVNISVFDGEFFSFAEVEIQVRNRNQEPSCNSIPELYWDEDEYLTIDLSVFCYDLDNDSLSYYFYDTSSDEGIILSELNSSTGIANFTSVKDWNGEDWVRFSVSDGDEDIITNRIELNVIPVNDAIVLEKNISKLTWNEDTNLINAINLNDYFSDVDVDDFMNFGFLGNLNIIVEINQTNGEVSFYPNKDWFGIENVSFFAVDSFSSITYSNQVSLEVIDSNEPPVFEEIDCIDYMSEDFSYSCLINASDFEGDELTFSVISETNMDCSFNENNLTYQGNKDYFGEASCKLRVSDSYGSEEFNFEVEIVNENDAPVISSFSPNNNLIKLLNGQSKTFEIDYLDIDNNGEGLFVSWGIFGKKVGEGKTYTFSNSTGEYTLYAIVSDLNYIDYKEWNISVQEISGFTCSEVSGFVCSETQFCSQDYLGVGDSASCCPVACSVRPPEFNDAKTCSDEGLNHSSLISIDIREPDFSEDFIPGEEVEVEIRIKNEFLEDLRYDVDAYLYDLSENKEIKSKDDSVKVDEGRSESVEFTFELDRDLENNNYAIFVRVFSDKENLCNQDYVEIDVVREDDDIEIEEFSISPASLSCLDTAIIDFKIQNYGTNDYEDTYFVVYNKELGINQRSDLFDLDEFDERKDEYSESISFLIPENASKGTYKIQGTYYYDDEDLKEIKTIDLVLGECKQEVFEFSDSEINLVDSSSENIVSEKEDSIFRRIINGFGKLFSGVFDFIASLNLVFLVGGLLFLILLIVVLIRA